MSNTTIVTVQLDAAAQTHFNGLRVRYYPAALNQIAAHLTLFHTLPLSADVRQVLEQEAGATALFDLEVASVRSLGRGVAFFFKSEDLLDVQRSLAAAFADELSAQDRQGFRPHVVVQNKVSGDEARLTLKVLTGAFNPWPIQAVGLEWWEYLGGPWRLIERFPFRHHDAHQKAEIKSPE